MPAHSRGQPIDEQVRSALAWLKRHSRKATRDGMARFAIPSDNAYGVSMTDIKALGKDLGTNQPLARALWATGLTGTDDATARWIGKDAVRELTGPSVTRRLGGH